jgi:hypothetical protein
MTIIMWHFNESDQKHLTGDPPFGMEPKEEASNSNKGQFYNEVLMWNRFTYCSWFRGGPSLTEGNLLCYHEIPLRAHRI